MPQRERIVSWGKFVPSSKVRQSRSPRSGPQQGKYPPREDDHGREFQENPLPTGARIHPIEYLCLDGKTGVSYLPNQTLEGMSRAPGEGREGVSPRPEDSLQTRTRVYGVQHQHSARGSRLPFLRACGLSSQLLQKEAFALYVTIIAPSAWITSMDATPAIAQIASPGWRVTPQSAVRSKYGNVCEATGMLIGGRMTC